MTKSISVSFPRVAAALLTLMLLAPAGAFAENQAQYITPAWDAVSQAYDAKHTPKITAPEKVKAGEWFDVTIEIGQGARHPSFAEHYVRYIALYKGDVELARAIMHPVHTTPKVTFSIALVESTKLRVLAEPNHAAAFEASVDIEVEPAPAEEDSDEE